MPSPMYEIVGEAALLNALRELGALSTDEELDALEVGANILRDKVQDNVGAVGLNKTDTLSHSFVVERRKALKEVAVGTPLGYRAWIHETGGTIRAKRKPFLVIKHPDGGFRKVKSVYIPKRAFFRPAVEETKDAVAQAIRRKFVETLSRKAGL